MKGWAQVLTDRAGKPMRTRGTTDSVILIGSDTTPTVEPPLFGVRILLLQARYLPSHVKPAAWDLSPAQTTPGSKHAFNPSTCTYLAVTLRCYRVDDASGSRATVHKPVGR